MKKKLLSLLIVAFALCLATVNIFAMDGRYIYDEVGVLSDQELESLDAKAQDLREKTGVEFYIVLNNDTAGLSSEEYAKNVFREVVEANDAFVLLIDEANSQIVIEASGWGNEYKKEEIIQDVLTAYNSESTYYKALEAILKVWEEVPLNVDPNLPEERLKELLVDDADLLSENEEAELLALLEDYSQKLKCEIAIVTIESLNGEDVYYYASDYYDYNGYGYGQDDSGILLLISIQERAFATTTYGYGIYAFTDEGLTKLENAFLDELSDGDYYEAFKDYADTAYELIEMAKDGNVYGEGSVKEEKSLFDLMRLGMSALVGVLVAFIATSGMKKELNNVKMKQGASDYVKDNHFNLRNHYDFFTHRTTSRTRIERSNDSSGSGTRTTTRTSSGRVHGGRGGRF